MVDRIEKLGPAETILQSLTTYADHAVHNRPGCVSAAQTPQGAVWVPVTVREKEGVKTVFRKDKAGNKTVEVPLGTLEANGKVRWQGRVVGEYRKPGLFPEIVTWMYRQVASVFEMDNEFAAKWASWAYAQDSKDLKVILAAFMLVQSRKGDPVLDNGEIAFHDDDYRDVGAAMCLIRGKSDLNPRMLLRVGEILKVPGVAAINRELGFSKSDRSPAMGRYEKVVTKWLRHRERNLPMLQGLVKAGFTSTVKDLCRMVGYKPETPKFFEVLRWKQKQAKDGRREILDVTVADAETWEGLTEAQVCQRIVTSRYGYKKVVGLLPTSVGVTRAVMAACIEAGGLSNQDLVIMTPTLEDLDLLKVPAIAARHQKAMDEAVNARAANVARNVRSVELKEKLNTAADQAVAKVVAEATKELRIYLMVDKSGSMEHALERAKVVLQKLVAAFPLEKLHVSAFNTYGSVIDIKAATRVAVEHAFRSHKAGGGTMHQSGLAALVPFPPKPEEDVLLLWVGDQAGESGEFSLAPYIQRLGWNVVGFGLLDVNGPGRVGTVRDAARVLRVPCFDIDENLFGDDPYALGRTLRNLIATTPVSATRAAMPVRRVTLVDQILKTDLLKVPMWAAA